MSTHTTTQAEEIEREGYPCVHCNAPLKACGDTLYNQGSTCCANCQGTVLDHP